jgi:hypothetical protein
MIRRFLCSIAFLVALVATAEAATLTISITGSALPTVNQTKTYTVSDTDLQAVLNWAASNYAASLPVSPTNAQILLAWVQGFINATKNAVVQFQTPPPAPPPPPTIQ